MTFYKGERKAKYEKIQKNKTKKTNKPITTSFKDLHFNQASDHYALHIINKGRTTLLISKR